MQWGKYVKKNCFFRSGGDSAFILNTILWKSSSKQKKVHVSFLDLQKAYDSVDRQILWAKLRKLGVGGKFLDSLTSLYSGDFVTSTVNGVTTNPVFLGRGLRQGCSLSPLLFALYVVDMSRELAASKLGVLLKKICISVLFFADDIALIAKTPEGLRKLHHIVQEHCSSLNMKLSTSKYKVMSSCSDAWELFEEDEIIGCLEKVLNFRYLGVETSLHPYQAAKAMRKRATQISNRYSVCSQVVPRLEEAILTPVLKKNFKRPLILGQEGHNYPPKHSNLSYDQFGGGLEQSDTAPPLLPPGWRDTDSFSWICSVFNSSISRRS